VEISDSLMADLSVLTDALEMPGATLEQTLDKLGRDASDVVELCQGLSITVVTNGFPISFVTVDPEAAIRSSVRLSLPGAAGGGEASRVVFYAAQPNAFDAFARGRSIALGVAGGAIVVDGNLEYPAASEGLEDFSAWNQAVGILMASGRPANEAREELRRSAGVADQSLGDAARDVIARSIDS
jgi:hypothetical protein